MLKELMQRWKIKMLVMISLLKLDFEKSEILKMKNQNPSTFVDDYHNSELVDFVHTNCRDDYETYLYSQTIKEYLNQEKIIYEVYQEERIEKLPKRTLAN